MNTQHKQGKSSASGYVVGEMTIILQIIYLKLVTFFQKAKPVFIYGCSPHV
jgi:hypothetical protein